MHEHTRERVLRCRNPSKGRGVTGHSLAIYQLQYRLRKQNHHFAQWERRGDKETSRKGGGGGGEDVRVRPGDFPLLLLSLVLVIELSQFADFFQLASLLNVHLHWPKSLSYRTHLSLSLSLARSFLFILISPTFICAGGGGKEAGRGETGGEERKGGRMAV